MYYVNRTHCQPSNRITRTYCTCTVLYSLLQDTNARSCEPSKFNTLAMLLHAEHALNLSGLNPAYETMQFHIMYYIPHYILSFRKAVVVRLLHSKIYL
jgi:hypothetical protein